MESVQKDASSSARASLDAIEELLDRYRPAASSREGSREGSKSGSVLDSKDALQHAMDILNAAGIIIMNHYESLLKMMKHTGSCCDRRNRVSATSFSLSNPQGLNQCIESLC